MEVNSVKANNLVSCIQEQADEQSLSSESSDDYNVFGDPDIFPRVGEQHQVEIPPLISESDYYWFQKNPYDAENTADTPHEFRAGLPIPIIWIIHEAVNNKHEPPEYAWKSISVSNKIESSKLECTRETPNSLDFIESNPKPEAIDSSLVKRIKSGDSGNSNVEQETEIEMQEKHKGKGHCLVPGSSSDTWNEIEQASFILGLYIFGKNLVQVKRFIGNKRMGDILSFYYGEFYKSDRYQRWSECRKMRNRKCIFRQKIFTGARQQELLSRLFPCVSEECRNKLVEVSKTFAEGKMLLEDYVLTLKDSVGLNALVEAVGVGKGKEDLTGLTADSLKSTQALPARPEIPTGKDCSELTVAEIINFLTGNFRLSKARSSDLFWEAVWPRLLARGWHSEQPGYQKYAIASKHPVVFLVPGVKKFSRKLVKGNHYFDSLSDILGKVASDPELIEYETEADDDCRRKEGNDWTKETKLDQENSPDQQHHYYLKPQTPNRSTDVIKFTVVDTTMAGENITKVRELRSLPVGVLKASSESYTDDDKDTSEEQTNESDSVNTVCFDREKTDITKTTKINSGRGLSSDMNSLVENPSRKELPMSGVGSTNLSTASKDQKTDLLNTRQRKKAKKRQSSQKMVPDNKNVLAPVTKRRRRLTACSRAERNSNTANVFVVPKVKQEEASCCPDNPKSSDSVLSQEIPPQEVKMLADPPTQEFKTLADPLSNASLVNGKEAVPATSSSGTEDQHEKPQVRTMIDLNLPVFPEVEADEPFVTEMTEREQNSTRKEADYPSAGPISEPVDDSEHQPDMNTRRKSTRNRPLTTKALEALAFGYLDRKEKRKNSDYPRESSTRPSRRARRKVTGETSNSSGVGFQREESINGTGDGNVDLNLNEG